MDQGANYWDADLLGRREDSEFLYNFLVGQIEKRKSQGRTASYVLNIDADWGGGKSFFLDGFALDLEGKGHMVARINAWRDDHAVDPYIAIMAAIDKAFAPFVKKPGKAATAWASAKASGGPIALRVAAAIGKGLVKKHAGVSLDELKDLITDDNSAPGEAAEALETAVSETSAQLEKLFDASVEALIDGFNRTDDAITDFREKLETAVASLSTEKKSPLFVLIDELDRCRPTYAVQLLERVKHLFDVEGVVFVFATNTQQLQHSIAGAYGPGFDGMRYLRRFFDRAYVFEKPAIEDYVAVLCAELPANKIRSPEDNLRGVLTTGFNAYGFELRAIKQVMEVIDATATAWHHPFPIDILLLFPLCANFYITGKAEWPAAPVRELENWKIDYKVRSRGGRDSETLTVSFVNGYGTALSLSRSLERIINYSQDNENQGPVAQHLRNSFMPEWNNKRYNPSDPSVQTELPGLVANAGKMRVKKPD